MLIFPDRPVACRLFDLAGQKRREVIKRLDLGLTILCASSYGKWFPANFFRSFSTT
jgi:hypothetical protein